ncbi:hypothetical protein ACJX0J_018285, partial [Zea mays]
FSLPQHIIVVLVAPGMTTRRFIVSPKLGRFYLDTLLYLDCVLTFKETIFTKIMLEWLTVVSFLYFYVDCLTFKETIYVRTKTADENSFTMLDHNLAHVISSISYNLDEEMFSLLNFFENMKTLRPTAFIFYMLKNIFQIGHTCLEAILFLNILVVYNAEYLKLFCEYISTVKNNKMIINLIMSLKKRQTDVILLY